MQQKNTNKSTRVCSYGMSARIVNRERCKKERDLNRTIEQERASFGCRTNNGIYECESVLVWLFFVCFVL